MKVFRRIMMGLAMLSIALGVWAFWIEPASLVDNEVSIAIHPWPQSCDDLQVAVIADLHVGSPHNGLSRLRELVDETNALKPDLILLAGDFVIQGVIGGEFAEPRDIAAELDRLQASLGVYAVMGNHDWWHGPQLILDAFAGTHIEFLEDASKELTQGDCRFWLAGVSDYWEGAHDIGKALADIPAEAPILAFTHNPDVFYDFPHRVSLTFAGHTHGGQVNLPLIGRPIVPSQYGERFAIGHIDEDGRQMFVTPGVGTSILPVRFRVPPEISLVTLKSMSR
ncbi:predicted phosphohydrolase [Hahella chejuensis KCTC 2396]|uniref:Predicted phosphohydrolase n=1 Tax=Hahella chejuensis (strain KCTC 2396) TaxID=349521 RepID=Q2SLR8_HAHCH|nr:metallophosphoesterase [Hahella chejuensis]ABC28406.1 predicted phosphohydrolase [Hahella chejuensis KCTC 2396]